MREHKMDGRGRRTGDCFFRIGQVADLDPAAGFEVVWAAVEPANRQGRDRQDVRNRLADMPSAKQHDGWRQCADLLEKHGAHIASRPVVRKQGSVMAEKAGLQYVRPIFAAIQCLALAGSIEACFQHVLAGLLSH